MLEIAARRLASRAAVVAASLVSLLCVLVSPAYAAPPSISVLHSFHGADGASPRAPLIQASDGNFYGTTYSGGDDGKGCAQGCDGTVFKITAQGQFTLLHTFVGGGNTYADGRNPDGGLVEGPDGYLYGTTVNGGVGGHYGVFYRISKSGQFQKLHAFDTALNEGTNPQGALALGHDGYFYGTATNPPAYNRVFRITSTGIYSDIKNLYATGLGYVRDGTPLQASDDSFYGVTTGGIYRVTPALGFAPVYFFATSQDGTGVSGLIQATDGNLYGATTVGPGNRGFVFRLGLNGSHQNILALSDTTTGVVPSSLLQASDGNLWGTTELGGIHGLGFVYATTTSGALVYSLPLTAASTGIRSMAPLIQGTDGKLYGTASSYGPPGTASGTIFVVDAGLTPSNQVAVPDVVAVGQAAASTAITNAGLVLGTVTFGASNQVASGVVISQSPSPGTLVSAGSAVNLVVSSGALQVPVPDVVGMTQSNASAAILGASLAGVLVTTDVSTTAAAGTVISQSPSAGTLVNPGSLVNLVVSSGAPPGPLVVSLQVLFGSQSYDVTNSTRHNLPWRVTGIRAVFSEPIPSATASSLSGVHVTGFSGIGTNTLTWAITPVARGTLALALAGSGPNAILNAAGAGLGAGAGFTQASGVLWGDFNDDGVVTAADLASVNNATTAPYNVLADVNGDGVVNISDTRLVRTRLGTSQFQ